MLGNVSVRVSYLVVHNSILVYAYKVVSDVFCDLSIRLVFDEISLSNEPTSLWWMENIINTIS